MKFDEFAVRHLAAIQRFAAVLTGDQIRGDDLVQEVLVRAHVSWRRIGSLDRPEFYVRKMIVNEFLSSRRRTWWLVPAGSGTEIDRRVAPDHASDHADRDAMLAELSRLPAQQRAVLVLRYYEGLDDGRIGELLGIAAGTVRSYASRALATLRIEMTWEPAAIGLAMDERR
ncbi:MAG TPA: SigE family RNA polymerase sigma factor [Streptosporangiaceae bacterium]|nr:SigE family RNA polymerase sigma factor [Streptosporangiaceae bacterium]